MNSMTRLSTFTLGILCATQAVAYTEPKALDVRIDMSRDAGATSPLTISVTVRNMTDAPLYLPKYRTPLFTPAGHLMGNVFDIVDEHGEKASFIGRYIRISPSDPNAFYGTIGAGEIQTHIVDLAADYQLAPGKHYKASYVQPVSRNVHLDNLGEASGTEESEKSNELDIELPVDATSLLLPAAAESDPGKRCTSDQMAKIYTARSNTTLWTFKALTKLKAGYFHETGTDASGNTTYAGRMSPDPKYVQWFGSPTNTAESHFVKVSYNQYWNEHDDFAMLKTLNSVYLRVGGEGYICGCSSAYERTAAWTERANGNLIHICDFFYRLPVSDTVYDNQLLTLIHEYSHFSDSYGGQTEDYAYGRQKSQELTRTNREQAVKNADSVMLYVGSANQ